ncbi:hypothetical protein J4Q44_G00040240 [Coregonus suidteri]|uniref:PARP catalytic domain-containing protein n=1 Tax=Coregonus suidteri TaxID=861788 RepID=A0AAN8REN3_9TELE
MNTGNCVYDPKRIKVMQVMKVKENNISRYRHLQSGVTPEDSHVYVMYHGTSKQAAVEIQRNGFKPSTDGMLDRMVLKVKVDVGRVKIIDVQGHDMQYNWHTKHGYDTAWVPPGVDMVPSNQQENCVYDPTRIKVMALLKVAILKKLNPSLEVEV